MIERYAKILILSAAIVVGGPIVMAYDTHAVAAARNAPAKLTVAQMLDRQQVAVTVISKRYAALPRETRGQSAPFLKGLIDLASAYRDVAAATKAHDKRKMGIALPKLASALAKANSAYQLSGIRDQKIAENIKSLNTLWKTYLKVVSAGAPQKSKDRTAISVRKVSHMRQELKRRGERYATDRRAIAQQAYLLALLDEAEAASRRADQLLYASMLIAEVYGYYAGAYEYYTVYEPAYAVDYRESWQFVSTETHYFYSESVSYYEEYSWSSYEQTIEVTESYEFGLTEREFTSVETEVATSGASIDSEAIELYESSEEHKTLDSLETEMDAQAATVIEAPEPDAVAPGTEDAVPADTSEAPQTDNANGGPVEEGGAQPTDESCAGDTPPPDCAASPAEEPAPDQTAPDEQPQEEMSPSETPIDEAAPDEQSLDVASPSETPTDEAVPDDQPQDESSGQADEGGDICASDNPPADCFPNDQGAGDDAGGVTDEGAGDGQSDDVQQDAPVEEESGGGEEE